MFSLPPILAIIVFSYAYLWADRFSGGGFGWKKLSHDGGGPLRGHGTLYAGLVVCLVGFLVFGEWGALIGVSWAIARSCPWKFHGHSAITPARGEELYALVRHAYPVILIALLWFIGHETGHYPAPQSFIWFLVFPLLATILAMRNYQAVEDGEDINGPIEMARGALFGLIASLILNNLS